MNKMVLAIKDVVDTTCCVHRIAMTDQESASLSVNAWLQSGGDVEKIIDYLEQQLSQRRDDVGTPRLSRSRGSSNGSE